MFGKKQAKKQIDPEQLELIENAQKRIRQKKRLYFHFILFIIGSIILIVLNTLLGLGSEFKILGKDWFVTAVLIWALIFLYHVITVFVTNKFMGKAWEKRQLEKLVAKQQNRIDSMKRKLVKEEKLIAESEAYSESKAIPEKSKLTIIVAAGENNAIGKDNDLIWHLKNDLKRFKQLTSGHHIIMGRKTFESFPKPLPNRTHIVISRQPGYQVPEGVLLTNSLANAIELAALDDQPFIIGGGQIYKEAMKVADRIELTRVHASFEDADTFFPEIDPSIWKEIDRIEHHQDADHKYAFSFITYVRK